jgi:hypothetical protein
LGSPMTGVGHLRFEFAGNGALLLTTGTTRAIRAVRQMRAGRRMRRMRLNSANDMGTRSRIRPRSTRRMASAAASTRRHQSARSWQACASRSMRMGRSHPTEGERRGRMRRLLLGGG